MLIIEPTDEELSSGILKTENIDDAIHAMDEDGYLAIKNAVPADICDRLYQKMVEDGEQVKKEFGGYQGLVPPPMHPWLFKEVLLNDLVISVTHAILGDGLVNEAYGSNWQWAGNKVGAHHVHGDHGPLWETMSEATPAFKIVVNYPICDYTEANGATQIWPGTHKTLRTLCNSGAYGDPALYEPMLAEWREKRPPHQLVLPKGSAIIRDMRTWHAGMQNHTNQHRGMLVNIHTHRKFKPTAFRVERGSEDFFEHPVLTTNIEVVEAPIQYLPAKNGQAASGLTLEDVSKIIPADSEKSFDEIRRELPGPPSVAELRDFLKELSKQGRLRRSGSGIGSRWRRYVSQ
ncbi:MAG: phytanoyl-CoA dioxygenase family protein [Planctomycetota bacterium]|nr:phytanoyl-CoA dioxygenase family protein [Planctomycetota bacterium]MDA1141349.1 phytanoyl-CoA dioxygenase family protein [Planctomycetota bacterium]